VMSGAYRESCAGASHDFVEGDLIVKDAAAIHHDHFGRDGAECLLLELSPKLVRIAGISNLGHLPGCYRQAPLAKLGKRIYRELRVGDNVTPLALEALALELVTGLLRSNRHTRFRSPLWLRKVEELIEASLDRQPSLQELANEADVHPAHLSRVFRRHWGCSVGDFVRNRRISAVAQRLTISDESLASIAQSMGFADQSHMTRMFKQFKGLTPREFRSLKGRSHGTSN
jgi:AraC family transcriptional regulator